MAGRDSPRVSGVTDLVLGRTIPAEGAEAAEVAVATDDLVTHGVIVGMTGSGKTGLGIGLIEECLAAGVPTLLIDPKGDLTNLALAFPSLAGPEFEPWVDPAQAKAAGVEVPEYAAQQATTWREGLAGWGIDSSAMQAYKDSFNVAIYTPGSTAGIPMNVLGSLAAPQTDDTEVIADEIEGYVTSLLSIVGINADPLSSREHILLSNIISNAWQSGESLDLPALLARVQQPPMRTLGVFELDQFFPPNDRNAFAMKLNGVLAAPGFQTWITGDPVDIQQMLYGTDGKPRCAIVTTAHLSDEQRQSATSLVLAKLITWMRRQSGTTDLRVLVYMDEVAGYLPPTANPPTKKPIMLLMKQARAFGVGVVLSTQNPVDVDYKALSNAGTWLVGRLTTENDKARLLEGMSSAAGGVDTATVSSTISGLGKRQFLVRKAGKNDVETFGTRWVRSYLRGPMTRDQIAQVTKGSTAAAAPAAAAPAAAPQAPPAGETAATPGSEGVAADAAASTATAPGTAPDTTAAPAAPMSVTAAPLADGEVPVMPKVAPEISACYLDPGAAWTDQVGAIAPTGTGPRLEAAAVARVLVRYDDAKAGLTLDEEYEAVVFPLPASTAALEPIAVDYDDRDLIAAAPAAARYAIPDAKVDTKTYWTTLQRDLTDYLVRNKPLEIFVNPDLKAYSRVGEPEADFRARCLQLSDEQANKAAAALQAKYQAKRKTLETRLTSAATKAGQAQSARNTGVMADAGSVLGGFLSGRRSASSITAAAKRAQAASNRASAATAKVDEIQAQIVDLDAQLTEEIAVITDEWHAKAENVVAQAVTPKKTNVRVTDLRMVWLPTA